MLTWAATRLLHYHSKRNRQFTGHLGSDTTWKTSYADELCLMLESVQGASLNAQFLLRFKIFRKKAFEKNRGQRRWRVLEFNQQQRRMLKLHPNGRRVQLPVDMECGLWQHSLRRHTVACTLARTRKQKWQIEHAEQLAKTTAVRRSREGRWF